MPEPPPTHLPHRPHRTRWSVKHVHKRVVASLECGPMAEGDAPRSVGKRVYCYIRRLSDAYAIHQCSLMACACAYCALLSLVPLLIVGIAALGFFLGGSESALDRVVTAINGYVPINATFITDVLNHVLQDRRLIGFYGLIGLLFAAHQTFLAMQPALNIIRGLPETRHWLRQRFIAFAAAFYTLILLGADLTFSAVFAYLQQFNVAFVPNRFGMLARNAGLALLPILVTTFLFALLYQYLPAHKLRWRSAFLGAAVAALLWEITKVVFSLFVVKVHTYDRLYGSLSSLVILVVWMYYSMAILLLGAEIAADYQSVQDGPGMAEARAHASADLTAASGKEGRGSVEVVVETERAGTPTSSGT